MNHIHRIKTITVHQQGVVSERSFSLAGMASRLNIGLAILAAAFLLSYVMQTNLLASQTYRMRQAQDQLASILEQRNALVAQQSEFDDRAVLQDLAVKQGFVPAGAVVYLVQDTSVAAAR